MKKAILIVSFGTKHLNTLNNTIGAIERYIQEQFPNYRVYRAFTSEMIVSILKNEYATEVCTLDEAMDQMHEDGVDQVIVQPTYVVHSMAFLKLKEELKKYRGAFQKICLGEPLLNRPEDYKACVNAMIDEWKLTREEIIVIAGHGTRHYAQSAYTMLEYVFHLFGYTNVLVGTVRGFPDVNNVMEKLELLDRARVRIIPFMIVSGEHVMYDLSKGGTSWASRFSKMGFPSEVESRGLGEMQGIRRIFAEHIREALES